MKTVDLNSVSVDKVLTNEDKEVALKGKVTLQSVEQLCNYNLKVLDLTQGVFGMEEEEWYQCLGYSHCGPVYGNSGIREVEVLKRLLESVYADKVILPDDVARRHINAIRRNEDIYYVEVGENCKLFSMKDGQLYNKKGTILIYEQCED